MVDEFVEVPCADAELDDYMVFFDFFLTTFDDLARDPLANFYAPYQVLLILRALQTYYARYS